MYDGGMKSGVLSLISSSTTRIGRVVARGLDPLSVAWSIRLILGVVSLSKEAGLSTDIIPT